MGGITNQKVPSISSFLQMNELQDSMKQQQEALERQDNVSTRTNRIW